MILLDLVLSFSYTVYFRKFTRIILRSCWHSAGILVTGTQLVLLVRGGSNCFFLCHTCNETNTLIPFTIFRYDEHNSITWSDFVMGCWCRTHSDWQVFIFHWGLYQGTCTRILHCYNITVGYSASSVLCTILHSCASVGFPLLSHQCHKNFVLITAWRN